MAEEQQHQALYRRYRPQTPAEVLGQDHVVRALTGAIREGRLHHAFLFCGPRGTGKTSTARILAKMVNCEPARPPSRAARARNASRSARARTSTSSRSTPRQHGGVEDARELREKAPTAPVQGREKVYIIDEAQRLSREAFDALLKVFEEPPPGVRFVLATTEPHKMPATIVGRCQRFDFRRFTLETLSEQLHLDRVAGGRRRSPTSAAHAIARQARGLVPRRALAARPGQRARRLDDRRRRGAHRCSARRAARCSTSSPTRSRSATQGASFEIVGRLVQDGQDLRNVTAEALAHFRNLLLVKTAPGQPDLLDVPDDALRRPAHPGGEVHARRAGARVALLLAAQNDMRWTTSPRLSLELALVRATMPETDADSVGAGHAARASRAAREPRPRSGGADRSRRRARSPAAKSPADDVAPVAIEPPRHSRSSPLQPVEPAARRRALPRRARRARAAEAAAPATPDAGAARRRRRQRRRRAAAPFVEDACSSTCRRAAR